MPAYPKSCGDKMTFAEYNCVKCNSTASGQVLETELENTINLNKLLYCKSLTDIPHDYLVVDSFTDSGGYNNSVCTASTTSTYCGSALTGNYSNCSVNEYTPTQVTCTICGNAGVTAGILCYGSFVDISSNSSCCFYGCHVSCQGTPYVSLSNIKTLCFQAGCCHYISLGAGATACTCHTITGSHDDTVYTCTTTVDELITNCYCYVCLCTNCWCFYCNGAGKCQVTMSAFPNVVVNVWACTRCTSTCSKSRVCFYNFACLCNCTLRIQTVGLCFSCPIKMVYYTDEVYGSGTRVYNVIDASSGCCIATNIPVNSFCLLGCCVCCHVYEVVQCSDAISCIKSYAIAIGL